jgi:hypothetical protein
MEHAAKMSGMMHGYWVTPETTNIEMPGQFGVKKVPGPETVSTSVVTARAGNRHFWLLRALRAHTKRHRKPIYIGKR